MSDGKKCRTCAWYCHSNGFCYGNALLLNGIEIWIPMEENHAACDYWSFDGLEDWERDACKPAALVTMEPEPCCI